MTKNCLIGITCVVICSWYYARDWWVVSMSILRIHQIFWLGIWILKIARMCCWMERMYERRTIKLFNRSILRFNIILNFWPNISLKNVTRLWNFTDTKKVICQNLLVEQIINFINYENLKEKELFSMSIT